MGRFSKWMNEGHGTAIHAFHHDGVFFTVYDIPLNEGIFFDPTKQKQYKVCWQRNKLGHMQCAMVTADNPEKAANWVRQRWQVVKKSGESASSTRPGWSNEKVNADITKSKTAQALLSQKVKVTEINPDAGPDNANLEQAVGHVRDMIDHGFHYHQMEDGTKTYTLDAKHINAILRGILSGHIKPVQYRKGTEIYKVLASLKKDRGSIDPAEDDRINQELDAKFGNFNKRNPYAKQRGENRKVYNSVVTDNAKLLLEPMLRNLLKKIWAGDENPQPIAAPQPVAASMADAPAAAADSGVPDQGMGQPGEEQQDQNEKDLIGQPMTRKQPRPTSQRWRVNQQRKPVAPDV